MYIGDFDLAETVDHSFTTVNSSGVPTQLAGTPAISVYKDNDTTQSTSGVTLTVDFDTVTGLNHVRITLSSDLTFYAAGSRFRIVITTGTVGGNSVVGYVVGWFSIRKQKGRGVVRQNTAQAGGAATITLDASASANDDAYNDYWIALVKGTGSGQPPRAITDYNGTTKVATVDPSWETQPDATSEFAIFA